MKILGGNLQTWQRLTVSIGLLTLITSALIFVSCLAGFLAFNQFGIGGQSGLRTIAGIAISGCLLAAIGYWDK
tara:strand:- start:182 stop:400 length:219 start_codon:yes stop_codon:yes gene_type:complete